MRDAWAAALREAHEEIGLRPALVEFAGYLPDHIVGSGFRVTPVRRVRAARVSAAHRPGKVHDAFEVPLDFILDAANHKARTREYRRRADRDPRHPLPGAQYLGRHRRHADDLPAHAPDAHRRRSERRTCSNCSPSCAACAARRAVRGIANKPSPASRPTPSRRPTRSPMPSSAAIWTISRTSWATCSSRWCSMRRWPRKRAHFDFDAVAAAICDKLHAPSSACLWQPGAC